MEKLTYLILAGTGLVGLVYLVMGKLTGGHTDLEKPKPNPNIGTLTKTIQKEKEKLSKHEDNRSEKDVEDYYNNNDDK